jgi:sigma-B regulation protein RsbU (phosphoserine phosphatase)
LPIIHQGKLSGILYLENNLSTNVFTPQRLEVLKLLSSQIAVSIENARLYEQEKELARLQTEVQLAAKIQLDLLPKTAPQIPGYDIAGKTVPAKLVGGDCFDFISIDEHRLALCIGDVSGKGLPASLLMANVQATVRSQTLLRPSPKECVERSNKLLFQATTSDKFVSLFYGILDVTAHSLQFSNAGHDAPLVFSLKNNVTKLEKGGIPLGMLEGFAFEEDAVMLQPADVVVACSDGITEAMNENDEQFGCDRLVKMVQEHLHFSSIELIECILTAVKNHTGNCPQSDDMTIVVAKRTAG